MRIGDEPYRCGCFNVGVVSFQGGSHVIELYTFVFVDRGAWGIEFTVAFCVFVDRYNFVLLAECCCLLCIGLDELEFLKRSCEGFEIVSVRLVISFNGSFKHYFLEK